MKQTTLITVAVILTIFISVQTYFLFDFYSKNKALEKAVDIIDGKLEDEKTENTKQIGSIQQGINLQNIQISSLNFDIIKLEGQLEIINSESHDEKNRIDRITNSDSLTDILTGRYR